MLFGHFLSNSMELPLFLFLLSAIFFNLCDSQRIENRSYHELGQASYAMCIARLNSTSQVGCSSAANGNIGSIQIIENVTDFDTWERQKQHNGSFVLAISVPVFYEKWEIIRSLNNIQGLAIFFTKSVQNNSEISISDDNACPNNELGLYSGQSCSGNGSVLWNRNALSTAMIQWNFPIAIIVDKTEIDRIKNCTKMNNYFRYCAMEILTPMYGKQNSETCLRKFHISNVFGVLGRQPHENERFCSPIGDFNLLWSFGEYSKTKERKDHSVILILTRLDSFSLFGDFSPAARTLYPSVALTLAIAQALGQLKLKTDPKTLKGDRDVIFAFLNGESFDYIGSQRLVSDMHNGTLLGGDKSISKLLPSHIHSIIEIGQLGSIGNVPFPSVFVEPESWKELELQRQLNETLKAMNITNSLIVTRKLPPSSIQTFLNPPGLEIQKRLHYSHMLITDHALEFQNPSYHGFTDIYLDFDEQLLYGLQSIGDKLVHYLHQFLGLSNKVRSTNSNGIDPLILKSYINCLYLDPLCTEVLSFSDLDPSKLKDILHLDKSGRLGSYTSIFTDMEISPSMNILRLVSSYLLLHATAKITPIKEKTVCDDESDKLMKNKSTPFVMAWRNYVQNKSGYCIRSSVLKTPAVSPILENDYKKWGNRFPYSTWTESKRGKSRIRIFAKPTLAMESFTLVCGILIFLLSSQCVLGAVYNSHTIFMNSHSVVYTRHSTIRTIHS